MVKKGVIPWILLAIGLFVAGYTWATKNAQVKIAEERVKVKEQEITGLKEERKQIQTHLAELDAAILEVDAKAAAREAWLRKQIEKTNAATPQQLVDEGSRILEAKDITTDGKTVAMGVETWRRAVKIFQSEEGYRLTKEPDWIQKLSLRDRSISEFKLDAIAAGKQIAALESINKEFRDLVGKQKRASLFEKALYAGLGYALGTLAEKIR